MIGHLVREALEPTFDGVYLEQKVLCKDTATQNLPYKIYFLVNVMLLLCTHQLLPETFCSLVEDLLESPVDHVEPFELCQPVLGALQDHTACSKNDNSTLK